MYLKNINNHILKLTDEEKNDLINDLQSSKTNFHTQSDAYVSNHESTLENINDQNSNEFKNINDKLEIILEIEANIYKINNGYIKPDFNKLNNFIEIIEKL